MKNGIFTLQWGSIVNAVVTAAIGAVIAGLVTIVTTQGFDAFNADWTTIYHSMVNWALVAGVISLGQDFISTNDGRVAGVGPTAQG